eukprot:CAMPEP_0196585914 /NCGR_PEP_ID=MMETSP1081-20130531/52528_1 /TAXON_ID=36882 /ORGANISM="Pyramimonas amylifera, Strain CCMP720" /LENGTH=87 /DNA_ID=CAMNT_0041907617 /DNA_START=330 /DNA_END=593 /DNA_ORIENTATION=-
MHTSEGATSKSVQSLSTPSGPMQGSSSDGSLYCSNIAVIPSSSLEDEEDLVALEAPAPVVLDLEKRLMSPLHLQPLLYLTKSLAQEA